MKQEAPQQRPSRTGIPAVHGREHVKFRDYGWMHGSLTHADAVQSEINLHVDSLIGLEK